MATVFKYKFFAVNETPPSWLTDKVNIKHDVPDAMIQGSPSFPAQIDSAMKFSVPNTAAILSAMNIWSNYLDITFSDLLGTNNIVYGGWNPKGAKGSATTFTENGATGNYAILYNKEIISNVDLNQASIGNWGGWVHMHELGHVLGLSHPNPSNNANNDLRYTFMWDPLSTAAGGTKIPLTPGMQDIATLQDPTKFGESKAQDGDTTYKFTDNSVSLGSKNPTNVSGAPSKYVMTLWDRKATAGDTKGGVDTIDAEGMTTNVYITLEDGEFSSIGSNINTAPTSGNNYNDKGDPDGNTDYNVGIAVGAEIENAKGGSGNDYLKGNDLRNELTGNAGNDTLEGGKGNDQLNGGTGLDVYKFGTDYGIDSIKDEDNVGRIEINGQILYGTDQTFSNIYKGTSSNYTYIKVNSGDLLVLNENNFSNLVLIQDWNNGLNISLVDQTPVAPTGNVMNGDFKKKIDDRGTADPGDDEFKITNGNYERDTSSGDGNEAGALDLITGTDGNDVIDGKGGSDAIVGNEGNDYIMGGIGGDYLMGGSGKDTLMGGDGDDALYGSHIGNLGLPTDPNHTPPTNPYTFKQGTGFHWYMGYDSEDVHENGVPDGYTSGNLPRTLLQETDGNVIDGGIGNDFIAAGTASDYVHGGADKDEIWGMGGADILFGDSENDVIYGDGDIFNNTSIIWADASSHGNDIIDGGDGEDILFGQGGNDIIFGGADADHIWGDDPQYYTQLSGNDHLFGGAGNDQIAGGGGNDYLEGGIGNDILFGEDDSDTLIGGLGADALIGGLGADTIYVNAKEGDQLGGSQQVEDKIYYDITQAEIQAINADPTVSQKIVLTLANGVTSEVSNGVVGQSNYTYTFADGKQVLHSDLLGTTLNNQVNISSADNFLFGGRLNDYLISSGTANATLFGGVGNDTLEGAAGSNTLIGGDGNDVLKGGINDDYLYGGNGDDAYTFTGQGSSDDDYIFDDSGFNGIKFENGILQENLTFTANASSTELIISYRSRDPGPIAILKLYIPVTTNIGSFLFSDFSSYSFQDLLDIKISKLNLIGTVGNDTLNGAYNNDTISGGEGNDSLNGMAGLDVILGENGNDLLDGGAGNDLLDGGAGDDAIYGGDGNDSLVGGAGSDSMIGGTGNDVYAIDVTTDEVVELDNGGTDLVNVGNATTGGTYTLASNVENVTLTNTTAFTLIGNVLDNALIGNAADNELDGSSGNDTLEGLGGNDILIGDLGSDTLRGGLGNDIYRLKVGDGQDLIEDTDSSFFSDLESDTLIFDDVISTNLTSVTRDTYNLILNYGQSDSIVIKNHFLSQSYQISQFQFSDGVTLTAQQLYAMYSVKTANMPNNITTQNNDFIIGTAASEAVFGSGGVDKLYGDAGNDTLDGGTGTDYMHGGLGDDVYYVDSLDDMVIENTGGVASLRYERLTGDNFSSLNENGRTIKSSGDGRYLLIGTGFNDSTGTFTGIILKDTFNGTTSIATGITPNSPIRDFNISSDGKYLVFSSNATNLVENNFGDGNVFYRNLVSGEIKLATNWSSENPVGLSSATISADGRYVGYEGAIAPVFQGKTGLYVVDMQTGLRTKVNSTVDGLSESAFSYGLSLSEDGRFATFFSYSNNFSDSNNLPVNDLNGAGDVYYKDLKTGTLQLVSITADGQQGNAQSYGNLMSADGRYVVFTSEASNLVAGDINGEIDVFIKDMKTGELQLVSKSASGQYGNGQSRASAISSDGRFVAFNSSSTNFGGVGQYVTYIKDLQTGNMTSVAGEFITKFSIDSWALTIQDDWQFTPDGISYFYGTPGIYKTENSLLLGSASSVGGVDTVISSVSYTLSDGVENLTLAGTADLNATGSLSNNLLTGNNGNNVLTGQLGNDTLVGGEGNDVYMFTLGDGRDQINNFSLDDSTSLDVLRIIGALPSEITLGRAGNDLVVYTSISTDSITIKNYYLAASNKIDQIQFDDGTIWDQVFIDLNDDGPTNGNDNIMGTNVDDVIDALDGDDYVYGDLGNDILVGGAGNDTLDGGTGNDTLEGSTGNDTYVIDTITDVVTEAASAGSDTVNVAVTTAGGTYTVATNVENATLTNTVAYNLTGNTLNNVLTGNASNNVINGGTGNDTMIGGLGNDTYTINVLTDVITENLNEGTDLVNVAVTTAGGTYTLAANVENATLTNTVAYSLTGNTLDNVLTGNTAANTLNGGDGNDTLNGLAGIDTMVGGLGNDTYTIDVTTDVVTEAASAGTDTVNVLVTTAGGTYTVAANVENATLTNTVAYSLTGNALDNVLTGNAAANTLNGGDGNDTLNGLAGIDTLVGGLGNDTYDYYVGQGNDQIDNTATDNASATDRLYLRDAIAANVTLSRAVSDLLVTVNGSSVVTVRNYFAAGDSKIDQIVFSDATVWNQADIQSRIPSTPTTGDDNLTGTSGNDTIDALAGNDTVSGGDGNDQLLGNTGNDSLNGGNGNDTLNGGAGNDTMVGGLGDDVYTIDATADVVTEAANAGTDTVSVAIATTSGTYTLGTNVENGTLTNTVAFTLTGNTLDNVLTGNTAANTLNGGDGNDTLNGLASNDTMVGGLGNDTYTIDVTTDVITEAASAGTDTVNVAVTTAGGTYTVANNVENATLMNTVAYNLTGNTLNNVLTGNAATNTLNGGAGIDTMIGGLGNDTYTIDVLTDIVTENLNEGTDLVNVAITTSGGTYTLAANVENATLTNTVAYSLTGNALDNVLTGNTAANTLNGGDGNDTLNGLAGNDTMVGGLGNDTYTTDATGDVITEAANEGTDTVNVARTTSGGTYTLAANVENATLTNTVAYSLTGNALDNVLTGNAAANTLNGGDGNDTLNGLAGNDTMVGGLGNDTYTTDATGDVITEVANAGTDTVNVARTTSGGTYTLAANVENAILTNTVAYNLTSNALANYLRGNAANNTLTDTAGGNDILQGLAGVDILNDTVGNNLFDGGIGNDTMTGGTGRDIFIGGTGNDTITTGTGFDVISFNKGDGADIINASTGADNTISLGGNFAYSELSLTKTANDLILKMGATDQITLKDWYLSSPTNKSVINLQVVAEAIQGFSLGGADTLRNNRIENFNFTNLVAAFDAAGATANWQLTDARLTTHLLAGSDTAAIGGDLAYQYGKNSNLTGMGSLNAQSVISSASFGQAAQTLNNPTVWQGELVKLA